MAGGVMAGCMSTSFSLAVKGKKDPGFFYVSITLVSLAFLVLIMRPIQGQLYNLWAGCKMNMQTPLFRKQGKVQLNLKYKAFSFLPWLTCSLS